MFKKLKYILQASILSIACISNAYAIDPACYESSSIPNQSQSYGDFLEKRAPDIIINTSTNVVSGMFGADAFKPLGELITGPLGSLFPSEVDAPDITLSCINQWMTALSNQLADVEQNLLDRIDTLEGNVLTAFAAAELRAASLSLRQAYDNYSNYMTPATQNYYFSITSEVGPVERSVVENSFDSLRATVDAMSQALDILDIRINDFLTAGGNEDDRAPFVQMMMAHLPFYVEALNEYLSVYRDPNDEDWYNNSKPNWADAASQHSQSVWDTIVEGTVKQAKLKGYLGTLKAVRDDIATKHFTLDDWYDVVWDYTACWDTLSHWVLGQRYTYEIPCDYQPYSVLITDIYNETTTRFSWYGHDNDYSLSQPAQDFIDGIAAKLPIVITDRLDSMFYPIMRGLMAKVGKTPHDYGLESIDQGLWENDNISIDTLGLTSLIRGLGNHNYEVPYAEMKNPGQSNSPVLIWLDASDSNSMEVTINNEVTRWKDKGPQQNDAVSYTNSKRPQYLGSSNGVRFDNDMMEIRNLDVRPATHDIVTSFAIYKYRSGNREIWVGRANEFSQRTQRPTATAANKVHLSTMQVSHSDAKRTTWLDGVLKSTENKTFTEGRDGIGLGQLLYAYEGYEGAYEANNDILELIIVSGEVSGSQRKSIENYLTDKWISVGEPEPLPAGDYRIMQVEQNRYLDGYASSANDYKVVLRGMQNNDTQVWTLNVVDEIAQTYHIQHKYDGRYLDAYEDSVNDYRLVTRSFQNNQSQEWRIVPDSTVPDTWWLIQNSSARFADAHTPISNDYQVVSRTQQNNNSQRWKLIKQ